MYKCHFNSVSTECFLCICRRNTRTLSDWLAQYWVFLVIFLFIFHWFTTLLTETNSWFLSRIDQIFCIPFRSLKWIFVFFFQFFLLTFSFTFFPEKLYLFIISNTAENTHSINAMINSSLFFFNFFFSVICLLLQNPSHWMLISDEYDTYGPNSESKFNCEQHLPETQWQLNRRRRRRRRDSICCAQNPKKYRVLTL